VKRKIRENGFVIAENSILKKKNSCERLPDSQNSIVKKGRVSKKGSMKA
jgi:hypothetical protein